MPQETYEPKQYWGTLIRGSGDLSNVGQPAAGPAYNRWAYARRLAALRRALRGVDVAGARIFEAAYGECFYLRFWRASGAREVTGVDLSEQAWANAQKRFPDYDLHRGDLTDPETYRGRGIFDLVTAIDVLYHITDDTKWRTALRELAGLVDQGGRLVVTDKFPRGEVHQRFPHVRRRPLSMWREVAEAEGLALQAITPVFVLMDDPITVGEHPWLGRLAMLQWRVVIRTLRALGGAPRLRDAAGALLGCAQSLPERLLVRVLDRVPSTELVVFERPGR